MTFVFVYGTLRRGEPLHYMMRDAKFVSEGRIADDHFLALYDLGPYPAVSICRDDVRHEVLGELYECDQILIDRLDRVESEGSLYHRHTKLIQRDDDNTWVPAEIYIMYRDRLGPGARLIPSGDWKNVVEASV